MSLPERPSGFHISIVGNVGTGKSTLAKLIQKRLHCSLYLEEPEDYPFLRLFFLSPQSWGFANQLQFVITKFAQQAQIHHHNQCAVQEMSADATHGIWTPASYEIGHMSQAEMTAIGQVYDLLAAAPISKPDLIIVLQASVETLIERIRERGRDYEDLDPKFIQLIELVDKFTAQFIRETPSHLMLIDSETVNFTKRSRAVDAVLGEILTKIQCL
jgi:deoxyadenosine/deoxycytidine kinase